MPEVQEIKTIKVSLKNWDRLMSFKLRHRHSSIDETIDVLIEKSGINAH